MKQMQKTKQFGLVVGDLSVLTIALFLSLCVRSGGIPNAVAWSLHFRYFAPCFLLWIVLFYIAELYSPERLIGGTKILSRLLGSSMIAILLTSLMFYLLGKAIIAPKTLLAIFAALSILMLWGWRAGVNAFYISARAKNLVAFADCGRAAIELCAYVSDHPGLGYKAEVVYEKDDLSVSSGTLITEDLEEFVQKVEKAGVGLVVLGDVRHIDPEAKAAFFSLLGRPLSFMSLPAFYELVIQRVPVGLIDDLWFLDNIDLRSKRAYEPFKRLLDIILSIIGLLFSSLIWPLAALAIKTTSNGPVFFTQRRLGKTGKIFTMVKFRTMKIDGNNFTPTAQGDPRVTGVGRFLRASRIDEIPQLLNVLIGDMSFVGPRPERPEIAAELEKKIPFYNQRHLVKPGLTGWDQVSGEYHSPSVEDTYKKLQYDLFYVKNFSPLLDISIVLKTIMTVLERAGR